MRPLTGSAGRTLPALACLLLALAGCGSTAPGSSAGSAATAGAGADCQDQWHDVAESVRGLDEETFPSSLAPRWTTVAATIDYYRSGATVKDCQQTVETQIKAISDLRRFSEKLRPYDMSYQLDQVTAAIDLYLHDTLPTPAPGPNGKPVRPPTKKAVARAFATLRSHAAPADADLAPGWTQMASVSLDDPEALRSAVEALDALAQTSPDWQRCESALQTLVAAVRAQEGRVGEASGDDDLG